MENQKIQEMLKKVLKPGRYQHTIGVMHTAAALAMCWGCNIHNALKAGLLHDCGKHGTDLEQIERCKELSVELTEAELQIPALVHAKLGAYYASTIYEVEEQQILDAIRYHTTGRPEMTLLEKIVYLADYIEPYRRDIPGLSEIRETAFRDIDKAVCMSSYNILSYLKANGSGIDPATVETYEYYKQF